MDGVLDNLCLLFTVRLKFLEIFVHILVSDSRPSTVARSQVPAVVKLCINKATIGDTESDDATVAVFANSDELVQSLRHAFSTRNLISSS